MARKPKTDSPAPTPDPAVKDPVREQVKQMSGHATEAEMVESLPENTMTATPAEELTPTGRPRRKNKPRAVAEPTEDPLMTDPIYKKHVERMRSKTGGGLVTGGFKIASKVLDKPEVALTDPEQEDVKGCFYVASRKFGWGLDPTSSPWTMAFYLFGLIGTFVFSRVAAAKANEWTEQFKRWFKGEEETTLDPDAKEGMDK